MKRAILLGIAILLSTPAWAVKEYYSISRSVRALGEGGAFYGLSDDEYAIFYNPAGTALYPGGAQFYFSLGGEAATDTVSGASTISNAFKSSSAASIASTLQGLSGRPLYGGGNFMASFLTRGFEIGILVANAKADIAVLGSQLASELDATAIVDSGLFLNKSFQLGPQFVTGVTVKYLYRMGGWQNFTPAGLASGQTVTLDTIGGGGAGLDADLGATYLIGTPGAKVSGGISLSLNNLFATDFPGSRASSGAPPQLPRMISAGGFAILRTGSFVDNIRLLFDVQEVSAGGQRDTDLGRRTGSFWKHIDLGAELPLGGWMALRTGLHQGNFTAGLGLNLRVLRLDFATYAEELDSAPGRLSSRRYALELSFGFGAPATGAVAGGSSGRSSRSGG